MSKSALKIVMGAMTFGAPGTEGARIHDIQEVEAVLDIFQSHGHNEIDSARSYCAGTSEEYLGQIDCKARNLKLDTKYYPNSKIKNVYPDDGAHSHSPADLRVNLLRSLKALNTNKLEMWYLHGPDRTVPYEVTLKAVNDLHKEGLFDRFGISNYMSWEVAQMVEICKANGYIQPTVYQGLYNAIQRTVEPELFPCLRKYGISFYAFSPLGGGFFTGRYNTLNDQVEKGGRFDPQRIQGQVNLFMHISAPDQADKGILILSSFKGGGEIYNIYGDEPLMTIQRRYWNDRYFTAISDIRTVAEAHNLTMTEIALRWISHHSFLSAEAGDAVIIGASSTQHIAQNLTELEKGPLPEDVVAALDDAWLSVKVNATNYWH
ncbi:Aldo/keto reductase [Hygrophoropsis aurantiaca]|uniref:Aldo/keto reductase n=1 Tax=Hygrophoropsis aurantiaca TaxID=72124 RepID=A0ACB8ATA7_9AGAM|nr:Aldo/keto reductase [Hygrophoropsis aurantiaca]